MASRSKRWSRAETLFLITTLDEMDIINRLDGRKHNNTDLFKAVTLKMIDEGFTQREDTQIRNKWKALKQEYNRAKAQNNKGGSDLSTFEFYDEVDRLLGERPRANADNHDIELGCNDSQIPDNPPSDFLPLSSLRLLVPPVQLLSAAMWQIVKEGAVVYYDLLEEFVSTVLETVPELLTDTETAQLVMGLRAKMVLELCRSDDFATPENIQPHLSSIKAYIAKQDTQTSGFEIKASMTNFLKLVNALVDNPHQRDVFYEKIFPMVFGKKYDSALQALMRKLLLNLQKLLPVPSLEQTSLWLSLSPPVLKECVDLVSQPEHLTTLIQHHKNHGHEVPQDLPSAGDDCILSSLSYRLAKVDDDESSPAVASGSDWHMENSLGSASGENFEEIDCEVAMTGERNGQQQHTDDLSEHQGASVEVILQPFDESDDEDSKKWFQRLKTHNRTSAITFECFACGEEFCSLEKLKRHKMTHGGCLMHKLGQADSARRSNVLKKNNLYPKPKSSMEDTASEDELSTHDPSNPSSPPSSEPSNDHCRVACHGCAEVFTYPKNSDTEDPPCSTSSAHRSQPNPVAPTKEPFSSEAEPPSVAPQDLMPSDSCKRSSRVKTCSICGEMFTCSADLTSHMRGHFDQNPDFCLNSEKDFDSSEDWETSQEGEFRNQQQENSSSGQNTKSHKNTARIQTVVDATADSQACKSPFTCQDCGQAFTFYKSFEEHQSRCCKRTPQSIKRTNSNHFIINACNFQSAGTSSKTVESETVAPRNSLKTSCIIKCAMCEKNFSDIAQMRSHYSESHNITGPYPCPPCKRAFVRLGELIQHQQNKKLYQCAACKKCYASPGQLNNHEKVHTESETPHACETCGKGYETRNQLLRHQRKHREEPCICSYCGKQFGSMVCLKAHMVRHTGGYTCQLCGKKFNQKTYLKWHMDRHMGKQPYLCDTCGKGWPSAAQLKIHMVQHSEERPFQCQDCDASYKRASHLHAHRQNKHIRLRPFACDVCGKTYRLNCELNRHMMVHTGERLFACPRCGKTFMQKSSLREHRERACL